MLLRYFYNDKLAHASYLVGCQAVNQAMIVDPGRDIDIYLAAAEANSMTIVGVTETHIHADYVSGARELAERTGATLYLSDEGDANWKYLFADQYPHRLLKDGDRFTVGNIHFDVLHTPGHTPEHLSFLLTDGAKTDQPMGLFTGDFVFVGSVGRPDLLEKAAGMAGTADAGARQMFASLQRFKELPDYLQIWPAHGAGSACGKGLGAVPSSTVGYEKLFNSMLQIEDEEEFVRELLADQPESPKYFAVMKRVNKVGPAVLHGIPRPELLPASRLPDLLAKQCPVVDTRPAASFAEGHLPGSINIPAPSLAAWAGWLMDYERPFYLVIEPGQSKQAVVDLAYIGLDKVAGLFEPGAIRSLQEQGVQLASYELAVPEDINQAIAQGDVVLVDVRNDTEWAEGYIPQARHIMLGYLPERAGEVVNGKPIVVQCRTGARSAIAASVLKAAGAPRVINMTGGLMRWEAAGLPVVGD